LSVECNLIISLLKLTKTESVLIEIVNRDARIPSATSWKLLEKLQNEGLVNLKADSIYVDSGTRLKLAVKAASLGADIQHIGDLLYWQEFEEIAAFALKNYGYTVKNNVRFKHAGHKYEIDVVGSKKPLVICIDCKHWKHIIAPSTLRRIVDSQVERTFALADSLPNPKINLECTKWAGTKFLPAVLSLIPSAFKFCHKVPIVPILQLQDFLDQLPVNTQSLKYFPKTFSSLSHNL
jgi:Holliday junction resolvase-like predicted endonuclease